MRAWAARIDWFIVTIATLTCVAGAPLAVFVARVLWHGMVWAWTTPLR